MAAIIFSKQSDTMISWILRKDFLARVTQYKNNIIDAYLISAVIGIDAQVYKLNGGVNAMVRKRFITLTFHNAANVSKKEHR